MSQIKKSEYPSGLSERLKDIRSRRGWNQEELANFLNVSKGSVGNWESGKNGMTNATLKEVAQKLKVSEGWLLGGEPTILSEEPAQYQTNPNVSVRSPEGILRNIPVISWAMAGEGGNFDDLANQIDEWVKVESKDPNSYALIVDGDSMAPNVMPGDRIVVIPNTDPQNGDLVVARQFESGKVYLKMFHLAGPHQEIVRLTSFNPVYPPLEFPKKSFRFIHPVQTTLRKWR